MVLPLRIFGLDKAGKPFNEPVHTFDVTSSSARLGGVSRELVPGDVIGVQRGTNKGRFRVIWVGGSSRRPADQVGVESVDKTTNVWGLLLPDHPDDEYEGSATPNQKRRHRRYLCSGGAHVYPSSSNTGLWGEVTEISLAGCYIRGVTVPLGTAVKLLMRIGQVEIDVRGVVRVRHAGIGMGVEFTHFSSRYDEQRLQSLLQRLEQHTDRGRTCEDAIAEPAQRTLVGKDPWG